MRKLSKLSKPEILTSNETQWLAAYKADRANDTKRYRYRDPAIKATLKEETCDKCVYCESKIGHNTPGDIEHKIPSSKNIDSHFDWDNLTIACGECNRRKNNYYEKGQEFLDPYTDDVEEIIEHMGPIVFWQAGHERAEITVRTLELNSYKRTELVARKSEKLGEFAELYERYKAAGNPSLARVLALRIEEMVGQCGEYSGMIAQTLEKKCRRPVIEWLNNLGSSSDQDRGTLSS